MNDSKMEVFEKVEKIVYLTPPSPVVLVSTVNTAGARNLAPFAMFTACSTKPPMLSLGISPKSDTFRNILQTKQFVVGVPRKDILEKLVTAGHPYPPEVDEFKETGLTPYGSCRVTAARIAECAVNFECELLWNKEAGNHHMVIGLVLAADMDTTLFSDDKIALRCAIPRVYHVTGGTFLVENTMESIRK